MITDQPHTVDVPAPPDSVPATVAVPAPVADAAPAARRASLPLAAKVAARKAERAAGRGLPLAIGARVEPEPDIPIEPLPPGAFEQFLASQPGEVGAAARARLEALQPRQAIDDSPIRARAQQMLADNLRQLEHILADSDASASDRVSAMAQIARIADAYSADGPVPLSARPLSSLSYDELLQRVAEVEARRSVLLAAVAGRAAPPGGGGK